MMMTDIAIAFVAFVLHLAAPVKKKHDIPAQ